jgi:hypothetical protein
MEKKQKGKDFITGGCETKGIVFKGVKVKLLTGDDIGKSNGKGREGF